MTVVEDWRNTGEPDDQDGQIDEYDLTSTPNDFNISTIFNFIESGAVKIPGFQRNYVWDIKRASKLIESLIIGLPVPQVFLYEQRRNSFLVIDGQQRLMTIYYFVKRRFPRRSRRVYIRSVFDSLGKIPDDVLYSDENFEDFNLRLPEIRPGAANKFNGLNYSTLGDYQVQFDLRTIRNVIVKQVKPSNDDSSVYEMFSRLNAGGVNLTAQEIRLSLYYSKFYDLLSRLNLEQGWRRLLSQPDPDINARDIEVLLRGIAVWLEGEGYRPSMLQFLNNFSRTAQSFDDEKISNIKDTVEWFIHASADVDPSTFLTRQPKFSVPIFEAVFAAACTLHTQKRGVKLTTGTLEMLKSDETFQSHAQQMTTNRTSVLGRRSRALELLSANG